MPQIPTREEAFNLLKKYNRSESLIKHALAVEGVMRYCARKREADEEKWGIIGLIHDLDYEQFPDQHCKKTETILREHDWPEEYISALLLNSCHKKQVSTDSAKINSKSEYRKTKQVSVDSEY